MRCSHMHTPHLLDGQDFNLSQRQQARPVLHRKRLQASSQDGHRGGEGSGSERPLHTSGFHLTLAPPGPSCCSFESPTHTQVVQSSH